MQRSAFQCNALSLMKSMICNMQPALGFSDRHVPVGAMSDPWDSLSDMIGSITPGGNGLDFPNMSFDRTIQETFKVPFPSFEIQEPYPGDSSGIIHSPDGSKLPSSSAGSRHESVSSADASASSKTESDSCCNLCGYRPKGDPRWFGGSMAKHMKLQHANTPPTIYRCPYPGCTSQFQKRPDNLRQHQIEKGHFVDAAGEGSKRASKRKKPEARRNS